MLKLITGFRRISLGVRLSADQFGCVFEKEKKKKKERKYES